MPADPGPESSVTGDDDRRAEIEAVAEALQKRFGSRSDWNVKVAEEAIAALDRVRDARGDDTPVWVSPLAEAEHDEAARSPDEDHEGRRRKKPLRVATEDQPAALAMWDAWDRYHRAVLAARSPRGEDHETARPEQPPPDSLGGQPPAEPPEAP